MVLWTVLSDPSPGAIQFHYESVLPITWRLCKDADGLEGQCQCRFCAGWI